MPHIRESDTVFLFGAGSGAKLWLERARDSSRRHLILDNDSSLWGTLLANTQICPPRAVTRTDYSEIIVLVSDVADVSSSLAALGVPPEAITIPAKPLFRPQPFKTARSRRTAADLLAQVVEIATSCDLEPVVEQGAALGAFRSKSLIPWDNDFDISFPWDRRSAIGEFSERVRRSIGFHPPTTLRNSNGIQVNFSTVKTAIPFSVYSRKASGDYLLAADASFLAVPKESIWPPTRETLEGTIIPIPGRPEQYFESVYGSDWETPRPEFTFSDYPQAFAEGHAPAP